jgi:hypothetical protein
MRFSKKENPLPTSPQIGPLREGLKLHRIISATKFFAWPVALPLPNCLEARGGVEGPARNNTVRFQCVFSEKIQPI